MLCIKKTHLGVPPNQLFLAEESLSGVSRGPSILLKTETTYGKCTRKNILYWYEAPCLLIYNSKDIITLLRYIAWDFERLSDNQLDCNNRKY